ncbi:MAG: AMP-binding protein [Bacteroides sp.]|nr:AMP-binding protein [Bacteroides sp.]
MTYPEFIEEWLGESEDIECNTSGSTGIAKRIRLPKEEVKKSAIRTLKYFGFKEGSLFYSCISPSYIGGKMMAVRACINNGELKYENPSNRPQLNNNGRRIDLLAVVPSQMQYLLDNLATLPPISHILVGGAPIPPALRKRIADSGLSAWETYGMTETASHIALRKIDSDLHPFYPLPGIKISKNKEECLEITIEGWQTLQTNDLVEILPDWGFLIKGRKDAVIISGGKKVNPSEIEQMLENEFGFEVLVTSEPDEKWGERIVYIIEGCSEEYSLEKINTFCRTHLPPEARPKEIYCRALPRTANGKKERKTHAGGK